jgi:hypothetical protein
MGTIIQIEDENEDEDNGRMTGFENGAPGD